MAVVGRNVFGLNETPPGGHSEYQAALAELREARKNIGQKKRKGYPPSLERYPNWKKVRCVLGWDLWAVQYAGSPWLSMKLVSTGWVKGKANYQLGYNIVEQRWVRSSREDHNRLYERRPELWAVVARFVEEEMQWLG